MAKDKDFVIDFGGNGLMFKENGEERPKIQELEDELFYIGNLTHGNAYIHKDDIHDIIILLQEVKAHGYKIDN
jgi:hypothetical protein